MKESAHHLYIIFKNKAAFKLIIKYKNWKDKYQINGG